MKNIEEVLGIKPNGVKAITQEEFHRLIILKFTESLKEDIELIMEGKKPLQEYHDEICNKLIDLKK